MDTSDPAILRTHDLMSKLNSLELEDPSILSESRMSVGEVYENQSPTRQQVKYMLQILSNEASKPPLPPSSTITYQSGISAMPKWKELDSHQIQVGTSTTGTNPLQSSTSTSAQADSIESAQDCPSTLMQQKLGNVSLETSTRIANILRKSTFSDQT